MVNKTYFVGSSLVPNKIYGGLGEKPHAIDNREIPENRLDKILSKIEREKSPGIILSGICKLGQVLFDGMLNDQNHKEFDEQRRTLDSLIDIGTKAAYETYFSDSDPDLDGIKHDIKEIEANLLKYSDSDAKDRHLAYRRMDILYFGKMIAKLAEKEDTDTLVAVMSGALEPTFVAKNIFSDSVVLPLRYSYYSRSDLYVRKPNFLSQKEISKSVNNRKVLVIEDAAMTGKSMYNVINYVKKFSPSKLYSVYVYSGKFLGTHEFYYKVMDLSELLNQKYKNL